MWISSVIRTWREDRRLKQRKEYARNAIRTYLGIDADAALQIKTYRVACEYIYGIRARTHQKNSKNMGKFISDPILRGTQYEESVRLDTIRELIKLLDPEMPDLPKWQQVV